jgi:hypothetical protein
MGRCTARNGLNELEKLGSAGGIVLAYTLFIRQKQRTAGGKKDLGQQCEHSKSCVKALIP